MTVHDLREQDFSPELLRVHQKWIDAELRGNIEDLLKLCTDDIQFLAPGAKLIAGKSAVRAFLERSNSQPLSIDTAELHFEVDRSIAFKTCRFTTRLAPTNEEGPEVQVNGIHVWILRHFEGKWLVTYVTWHCASDTAWGPEQT